MIPVTTLLYKIDMKLNKVATFRHQSIPVEDKILALNEAQIKLVKTKVTPNNNYQIGFDGFKKRYADIEVLVEKSHDHKIALSKVDSVLNKWVADITEVSPKFMFFVDAYVLADKGTCKDHPIFVNSDLVKHADVTTLLGNANQKPSFEYQETFCSFSGNSIELYTDGTFDFTNLFLSYIRYPKKIDIAGYEDFEGNPSSTQDCELPDYLEDELTNLTISELGFITENATVAQVSDKRLATQE